jgi:signal transduction histidine kinase
MKDKRPLLYLILGTLVILSLVAGMAPHLFWAHFELHDETLHSAVEAMGALAAVVMAVFLLRRDEGEGGGKFPMLALGFLCMGALDLFHAVSVPGHGFVFLHSMAGLAGGLFFALAWLPWAGMRETARKWLPWPVTAGSLLLGIWTLSHQAALPVMLVNGEFTTLAKDINIAAGILLVLAAARQLADFHLHGDFESYLFSFLLLLFGVAALTFSYSALWDDIWWFWHLERLVAYALVLWWVLKKHEGLVRELRTALAERKLAEEERASFFHMLTHDIRGPLTLIYGYSEILDTQVDAASAEMVEEIKKAAGRISALIEDMLTLFKAESQADGRKREPVPLAEVLDQAVQENRLPALDIDVTIDLNVDGMPHVVLGDRMQLIRAFDNLVANAVKYNRHGGTVNVRACADAKVPGQVTVEVKDTGIGVNEEDLPHVFEKFYRGSRTGAMRGTGLGLAVVKAVVESHGGTVSIASREREGSTFSVTLPVKTG